MPTICLQAKEFKWSKEILIDAWSMEAESEYRSSLLMCGSFLEIISPGALFL